MVFLQVTGFYLCPIMHHSNAWALLRLPPPLIKRLEKAGFKKPTPVQRRAIPPALAGKDLMAVAPTGSGKTIAYLCGIWHHLEARGTMAVVLVPTRELGMQARTMLRELDGDLAEHCILVTGGTEEETQRRQMKSSWKVLIATPGRLLDLAGRDPAPLRRAGLLVLDEFDRLLDMGFRDQADAVRKLLPHKTQVLCYSATPLADEDRPAFLGRAVRLDSDPVKERGTRVEVFYFLRSPKKKNELLLEELKDLSSGQALVFVRNREKANHLHGFLKLNNVICRALHGHLPQVERTRNFNDFLERRFPVLVATDIASRGFDTLGVDLVINYDLPQNAEIYTHRKGRTGRLGRSGRCVSYAGPGEYIQMRNIEAGLPYPIPTHPAYARKDKWYLAEQARHHNEATREKRVEDLKKVQGA